MEWRRLGLLHVGDGGRCSGGEAELRHSAPEKTVAWAVASGWARALVAAQIVGSGGGPPAMQEEEEGRSSGSPMTEQKKAQLPQRLRVAAEMVDGTRASSTEENGEALRG
jgi:hypothetical protein